MFYVQAEYGCTFCSLGHTTLISEIYENNLVWFCTQFRDQWLELINWLTDNEKVLDSDSAVVSNDPDAIKADLLRHKEFQKTLGAKNAAFDNVNRLGHVLKDKCPKEEISVIQDMLNQLKLNWSTVCNKAIDRSVSGN